MNEMTKIFLQKIGRGGIMADMTDEEYDALDERWTKTPPKVNFSHSGIFARQRALLEVLDKVTSSYIAPKLTTKPLLKSLIS
jgi:hypothetical protein